MYRLQEHFLTKFTLHLVLFAVMLGNNRTQSQVELAEVRQSTINAAPINSDLIPGIYDYESSQNFENYLQELGVNYILRKLARLASPAVTISTSCQSEDLTNVSANSTFQPTYILE